MSTDNTFVTRLPRRLRIEGGGEIRVDTPPERRLVLAKVILGNKRQTPVAVIESSPKETEIGALAVERESIFVKGHIGRFALMHVIEERANCMIAGLCRLECKFSAHDNFAPLKHSYVIYKRCVDALYRSAERIRLLQAHKELLQQTFEEAQREYAKRLCDNAQERSERQEYEFLVGQRYDVIRNDRVAGFSNSFYTVRRKNDRKSLTREDWVFLQPYLDFHLDHPPTPVADEKDLYLVNHCAD